VDIFGTQIPKRAEDFLNKKQEQIRSIPDRAGDLASGRFRRFTRPFENIYEDFFGEKIPGQFGKPSAPEKEADRLARLKEDKSRGKESFPNGGEPVGSVSPLSQLAASINGELARTNRFEVHINPPPIINGIIPNSMHHLFLSFPTVPTVESSRYQRRTVHNPNSRDMKEHLILTCEAATLPGRGLATVENKTYGPLRKHAYAQLYTEVTLTFLLSAEYLAKHFFEAWQQSIYDVSSHNMNYYNEYVAPLQIYQLSGGPRGKQHKLYGGPSHWQTPTDPTREPLYAIELEEAYPITIGDLTFNSGDENAYHKLPITFAFRKWSELSRTRAYEDLQLFTPGRGTASWTPEERIRRGFGA